MPPPTSPGPDSLHKTTVISVEYDKIARHGNDKDLKSIYFNSLHFVLTRAIFLIYAKISTHANFIDPLHPCQNFDPWHPCLFFFFPTPKFDPYYPRTHVTHTAAPPRLFSRLTFYRDTFAGLLLFRQMNYFCSFLGIFQSRKIVKLTCRSWIWYFKIMLTNTQSSLPLFICTLTW